MINIFAFYTFLQVNAFTFHCSNYTFQYIHGNGHTLCFCISIHIISLKILEVLLNAYVGLKNNLFRDNCIPQSCTFPYSNFMLVIPIYTGAVDSVWLHSFAGSVACNTNQPWESKTNYSQ